MPVPADTRKLKAPQQDPQDLAALRWTGRHGLRGGRYYQVLSMVEILVGVPV